jgi:WD40 repeat protein
MVDEAEVRPERGAMIRRRRRPPAGDEAAGNPENIATIHPRRRRPAGDEVVDNRERVAMIRRTQRHLAEDEEGAERRVVKGRLARPTDVWSAGRSRSHSSRGERARQTDGGLSMRFTRSIRFHPAPMSTIQANADPAPTERSSATPPRVFISHNNHDAPFATRLAERLRRFELPRDVDAPAHRLDVFIYQQDAAAGPYDKAILDRVRQAHSLVVVCSPNAAASPRVDDEITTFIEPRPNESQSQQNERLARLIPILLAGEPRTPTDSSDANAAFPPALVSLVADPIWIDYRRRSSDKRETAEWYVLLSTLFGVARATVEQRVLRERVRILRRRVIAAAAVVGVLAATAAYALFQRHTVQTQNTQLGVDKDSLANANTELRNQIVRAVKAESTATDRAIEAKRQLAQSLIAQGMNNLALSQPALARSLFAGAQAVTELPRSRVFVARLGQFVTAMRSPESLISFRAHDGGASAVAVTHDARYVVTGGKRLDSELPEIKLWDLRRGRLLARMGGHGVDIRRGRTGTINAGTITALDISPDESRMLSTGTDGRLVIHDFPSGAIRRAVSAHQQVISSASYSPDGQTIMTVGYDDAIRLWNGETGDNLGTIHSEGMIADAAFSPSGKQIAYIVGKSLYLYDVAAGASRRIGAFDALQYESGTVRFVRDDAVAISSLYGGIILFDLRGGKVLDSVGRKEGSAEIGDRPPLLASGRHGFVAFRDARENLRVLGLDAARASVTFMPEHRGLLTALASDSAGDVLVTVGRDGYVKAWPRRPDAARVMIKTGFVTGMSFDSSGTLLAATTVGGGLSMIDTDGGRVKAESTFMQLGDVVLSPDGQQLVFTEWNGPIIRWDARAWKRIGANPAGVFGVNTLAQTADGATILSNEAGHVVVRPVSITPVRRVLNGATSALATMAGSTDGSLVVAADEGGNIYAWHGERGGLLAAHGAKVGALAISRDAQSILSCGDDGAIRVWRPDRARSMLAQYQGKNRICDCWADGDFSYVLSFHQNGQLALWSLSDRSQLAILDSVGASPYGKVIVNASMDHIAFSDSNTIYLWNLVKADRQFLVREKLHARDNFAQNDVDLLAEWYALRGYSDWAAQLSKK